MKRILVLGYFGHSSNKLDGQTVKTRDVYRLVKEQYGEGVDFFDTEEFKRSKLSVLQMLAKVVRCHKLIYLPAHGNLKYLFPVLFCLASVSRVHIHYIVIGGWLREYLASLPLHRFMLSRISGIYVETSIMKQELVQHYAWSNVSLLPNFRFFDFAPSRVASEKVRLVFMARVNRMKGLDWIFHLCEHIASHGLESKFTVTFYGQINPADEAYFMEQLQHYRFAEYRGALLPEEIYATLSQYDVLLLPTHFYTEGLPGSVVDAYISGLPVIVTAWKYATEFVDDGVTGFIVPFEQGEQELIDRVMRLEANRDLLATMQANALRSRTRFAPPVLPF